MKNKLIVTDMDGTLIDTCKANFEAYKYAIDNCYGKTEDISFEEFKEKCFGKNYKFFLEKIYLITNESVREKIHDKKNDIYPEYYALEARVNEWLLSLLKKMKDESYVAIITTASKQATMSILEHFGLLPLFDEIITADDVKKLKPNTEALTMLIEKFKVSSKDTLYFDDADENLIEAALIGCTTFKVENF